MHQELLEGTKGLCSSFEINSPGALFEPMADTSLGSSDEKLITKLIAVLDNQLLLALESRSVDEFKERRRSVFPRYIRALRAVTDTTHNLVPAAEMDRIATHAIQQLGADLERQRGVRFGDKLVDQARFTLWTFGRMRGVAGKIAQAGKPRHVKADYDRSLECQYSAFTAQFHMDSIVAAMKFKKDIVVDVQGEICEGLRAVVNAYALMRSALDDRLERMIEEPSENLPWDQEDDRLLAASVRDINAITRAGDC